MVRGAECAARRGVYDSGIEPVWVGGQQRDMRSLVQCACNAPCVLYAFALGWTISSTLEKVLIREEVLFVSSRNK